MAKTLIILGILIVAAGLVWLLAEKLGLTPGRLPGDIMIERENFRFYIPITTMILASIFLSIVMWFLNR